MIDYRWIEGWAATPEEWRQMDELLRERGFMALNHDYSHIRVAERGGKIVGLSVLQMTPYCGPLLVAKEARGTGVAQQLADDTIEFLVKMEARGWIVVANSPHVVPLCERYGMNRITCPVYTTELVRN